MIGARRVVGRPILATRCAAALGLLLALVGSAPLAFGEDAAGTSREAIQSLQRRLTDAGCYTGAIDGAPSAALNAAIKACPDQRPSLRIEAGMHTARIGQIGVDAACRTLATSSEDKTVRLWSLPDGKLQRVVRLPIGDGNAGKINGTALSPDGRWLAAGGYDAALEKTGKASLSIIDLSNGAFRRIGSFPNGIKSIAYSADGRRVAVGLTGGSGVRVFDSASGSQLLADSDYRDDVYGLAFAPDGGLVTSSSDGQLRRYGPDFKLMVRRAAPDGSAPARVAIDPSGQRVAVGYREGSSVSILDARTLAVLAKVQADDLRYGSFESVAWSRDGATLVAGGGAVARSGSRHLLRRFDATGRRQGADAEVSKWWIFDIQPCGEGFAFSAADPLFGLLSAQGGATILQAPRAVNMRWKVGATYAVSQDGAAVRFGLGDGGEMPIIFDLATASLTDSPSLPSGLAPARVDGLPLTDWQGFFAPKFAGMQLGLERREMSRVAAIRPDASGFALGTDDFVRAYDAKGKPLWRRPGPSIAWGVAFSGDGQTLAGAYIDGTIRWLRWKDGVELLALFVEPQSRRWVAWTPTGYYMASAGGEDLIGWHINRGWAQEADFFPASRFSGRFNRPDIVQLVLKTRDEAAAVTQANDTAKRRQETAPIETTLPPVLKIVSPMADGKFSGDSVEVRFIVRSPSGLAIDRVDALIDGRPVETRGLAPAASQVVPSSGDTRRLTIPAPAHDFELALIARSGTLIGEAAKVRLVYAGAPTADPAAILKPKLYAVTIGVSAYDDPDLRLGYAADDARGFAEALQKQKGGLYGDVQVKTLVDGQATRGAVVEALEWLEKQVTSRDFGVVLIAGHGVTDEKQRYWFLPADASMQHLRMSAVSQDDIQGTMGALAGKAILFLDTCHANAAVAGGVVKRGPVDMNSIINEFAKTENGVVTFASSQGRETSEESAAWGHGAFTEALIEGLGEGKADLLHNGSITVSELDAYIAERVKALTEGRQHPVMSRPNTIPDFAFAVLK